VVFTMTTLVNEPKTAIALVIILATAFLLDLIWKRLRAGRDGVQHTSGHPESR